MSMVAHLKPQLLDASAIVSVRNDMKDTMWGSAGAKRMETSATHCVKGGKTVVVLPECKTLLPQKSPDATMNLCLPRTTGNYISKIDVKVDSALHEFLQLHVNGNVFSPTEGGAFEFPSQSNSSMQCTESGGLIHSMIDDSMKIIITDKPAGQSFGKSAIKVTITSHMDWESLKYSDEQRETCSVYPGAYTIPFDSPVNYMALECTGAVPGDELLLIHESAVVAKLPCTDKRVVITFTDRHLPQQNKGTMNVHTDILGGDAVNFALLSNIMLWTTSPRCTIGEVDYTCLRILSIDPTDAPDNLFSHD
jgi:hypothetical protein